MRTFFLILAFLILMLPQRSLGAGKPVYLDPDHPVYASKEHGFRLDLPPGHWGGPLSEDRKEVRFSDAAGGDEEFTEVLVRVLPAKGLVMKACKDAEMKGCR